MDAVDVLRRDCVVPVSFGGRLHVVEAGARRIVHRVKVDLSLHCYVDGLMEDGHSTAYSWRVMHCRRKICVADWTTCCRISPKPMLLGR